MQTIREDAVGSRCLKSARYHVKKEEETVLLLLDLIGSSPVYKNLPSFHATTVLAGRTSRVKVGDHHIAVCRPAFFRRALPSA